ncbi:MAG: hypothetical protein AAGJ50_08245, partial [Pseudomonadota bacterium]
TYRGAPNANASEVRDLALLRASSITLQKGGDWFEVLTEYSRTEQRTETAFQRDPFANRIAQTADCGVLGCTTSVRPEAGLNDIEGQKTSEPSITQSFEIMVHSGTPPIGNANAYDAVETSEALRARYSENNG